MVLDVGTENWSRHRGTFAKRGEGGIVKRS